MRIAKRLDDTAPPDTLRQRHNQLPPLRRSSLPAGEKVALVSPAQGVPKPPSAPRENGPAPRENGRRPKDAAGAAASEPAQDGDTKRDPLKGRKLQVLKYFLFLAVFVAACANGRTPDMYYQNSVVEQYMSLGQASFTGYEVRPSFAELVKWSDFWTYMIRGFAPGIFDPELRLPNGTAGAQTLYLVSGFRLHQVRVRPVNCSAAFSYLESAKCFPAFTEAVEDRGPFWYNNRSAASQKRFSFAQRAAAPNTARRGAHSGSRIHFCWRPTLRTIARHSGWVAAGGPM